MGTCGRAEAVFLWLRYHQQCGFISILIEIHGTYKKWQLRTRCARELEKKFFSEIIFRFATAVDLGKCFYQIKFAESTPSVHTLFGVSI